jgi:hypothetical protein
MASSAHRSGETNDLTQRRDMPGRHGLARAVENIEALQVSDL